jgi:hypothetical protein
MKIQMLTVIAIFFLSVTTANALIYKYEFGGIAEWDEDVAGAAADLNLPDHVNFSGSFRVNTDKIYPQQGNTTPQYFEVETSQFSIEIDKFNIKGNPGWAWGFEWDGEENANNGIVGSGGLTTTFPLSDTYWYETWISLHGVTPLIDGFSGGRFSFLCGSLSDPSIGFGGDIEFLTKTLVAPVPEPATMVLFGAGLVGLAGLRLRRKK